nr:MAG TPA: hypothetical protein [Caudoviricetes sp.]
MSASSFLTLLKEQNQAINLHGNGERKLHIRTLNCAPHS